MSEIRFKDDRIRHEWESGRLDRKLTEIANRVFEFMWGRWGWEPTITSIFRTKEEDEELEGHGVHPAWRALDIRTSDEKPEAVEDVVNFVNSRWHYDPVRPRLVVAYAKPHGTGPHIHLQVSWATTEVS